MLPAVKPSIESSESWNAYEARRSQATVDFSETDLHRVLKKNKYNHKHEVASKADDDDDFVDFVELERQKEHAYLKQDMAKRKKAEHEARKEHKKNLRHMVKDPGIQHHTVHGFMIDAGSTGSRLHLYEWKPRVLNDHHDVNAAVSGRKLSYPSSASRWTDRLRPGLATFAPLADEDLVDGIATYLSPLLEFAKAALREKEQAFETFPIFFRATAGMRTLDKEDRFRVLDTVRDLLLNKTFCPFYFEEEFARILSGEEEAIFGWAGINFAMGNLVPESEGAGTVINPKLTYGALDMGGASTQISFYEPNEDIMANLFKLQIGQGKHWNLYAHSFLYYGINEAQDRFFAQLLHGKDDQTRLVQGVYNPCLPGGSQQQVRLNIHIDQDGDETWEAKGHVGTVCAEGFYNAVLKNAEPSGDFDACLNFAKEALHLESNKWCNFAHRGECSFGGAAMPHLPTQSDSFGEFLAFSNYFHVWEFLGLPERASISELRNATEALCSMSKDEVFEFNKKTANYDEMEVEDYCFRSAYVFSLLHHGYGFGMDEHITATSIVNGQKVSWALGAMLYEINTLPWEFVGSKHRLDANMAANKTGILAIPYSTFLLVVFVGMMVSTICSFALRRNRNRQMYKPIE